MQKDKINLLKTRHLSLLPYMLLGIGILFGYIRFDRKIDKNFILEWTLIAFMIWTYVALTTGVVRDRTLSEVYRESEPVIYWIYVALNMTIVFLTLIASIMKWAGFYR